VGESPAVEYRVPPGLNGRDPGKRAPMVTVARPGPFATKPAEQLLETAEGSRLNRTVGALDLTALGIGAIIWRWAR
jgi:hypothetical protein